MEKKIKRYARFVFNCFILAFVIFIISLISDFSVKMFYSSSEPRIQIFAGLFAILVITGLLILIFIMIPGLRKSFFRMFGMGEESEETGSAPK